MTLKSCSRTDTVSRAMHKGGGTISYRCYNRVTIRVSFYQNFAKKGFFSKFATEM